MMLKKSCLLLFTALCAFAMNGFGEPTHGLALYGKKDVKYDWSKDKHFNYVNPNAPKGGTLRIATSGGFTRLNPYCLRGTPFSYVSFLVFESLMGSSYDEDESFTMYGAIAEKAEIAADRLSVTFWLNPRAKFSDGVPVTADDVVFSFQLIQDPGFYPGLRSYYEDVDRVEKLDKYTVRFHLKNNKNQELPLIVGQLPVLPKHVYGVAGKSFGDDFMNVAIGSGPYVIEEGYDPSTHIHFKKDPNWWGVNEPQYIGCFNFDRIEFKFFKDIADIYENVRLVNPKNRSDICYVNSAKEWQSRFDNRMVMNNWLIKESIPHQRLPYVQNYIFNLRRPVFQDRRVRQVICSALDFEKMNRDLFYNQYIRLTSYWDNNETMWSRGPAQGRIKENLMALAEKYGDEYVPAASWERGPWLFDRKMNGEKMPIHDRIVAANYYLDSIGWKLEPGSTIRSKDGVELSFEVLLFDASSVRAIEPIRENLGKMGIKCTTRIVQPAEYIKKIGEFDYDVVSGLYPLSENPGNELSGYFGSETAFIPSSNNLSGIQNPAIDEVIDRIVVCNNREDLLIWTKTLDRLLTSNHYGLMQWYVNSDRMVYWRYLKYPHNMSWKLQYPYNVFSWWWYDEKEEKILNEAIEKNQRLSLPEL